MKRASTLVNFVLIIGLLVISITIIFGLKKVFFTQAKWVEEDTTSALMNRVKNEIERIAVSGQDTKYPISIPFTEEYITNISRGKISIFLPKRNIFVETPFILPNVNIVSSSFSSSGNIFIYKKDRNVYVTDNLVCDVNDDKCDVGCIAEGLCDIVCYKDYVKDGVCNPYCIDKNNDGITNGLDSDVICDPDCYNNDKNGFYDVDCIKSNDDLCDVDSHNIKDGICDTDCNKINEVNGVCDPDCTDAIKDKDCSHRDNGLCELEYGENCRFSGRDCKCGNVPGIPINTVCRFECALDGKDSIGCVNSNIIINENGVCTTSCECADGLRCDFKGHCCKEGWYYKESEAKCFDYKNDNICSKTPLYEIDLSLQGENCINSPADCACNNAEVCCPGAPTANNNGCTVTVGTLGDCSCNNQCTDGICSEGKCCPKGQKYEGANCVVDCTGCEIKMQANPTSCPGTTCDCTKATSMCSSGEICCPDVSTANEGCISGPSIGYRDSCTCSTQCINGLVCNPNYHKCLELGDFCHGGQCGTEISVRVNTDYTMADIRSFGCRRDNLVDLAERTSCSPISDGVNCLICNSVNACQQYINDQNSMLPLDSPDRINWVNPSHPGEIDTDETVSYSGSTYFNYKVKYCEIPCVC